MGECSFVNLKVDNLQYKSISSVVPMEDLSSFKLNVGVMW